MAVALSETTKLSNVEGEPWVRTKMTSSSEALASASCKQWATSQMSAIQDCID